MSDNTTQIPIEIARAGKTEAYVKLVVMKSRHNSDKNWFERKYYGVEREIFRLVDRIDTPENEWTRALLVEQLSKQLVETAGQLAEAMSALAQAKADLTALRTEATEWID